MRTLKDSVKYVYNYIKAYDNSENGAFLMQSDIYDIMERMLLESVDGVLSKKDVENRVSSDDEGYIDKLLSDKMGEKYFVLLQAIANDILNEYILSESI